MMLDEPPLMNLDVYESTVEGVFLEPSGLTPVEPSVPRDVTLGALVMGILGLAVVVSAVVLSCIRAAK